MCVQFPGLGRRNGTARGTDQVVSVAMSVAFPLLDSVEDTLADKYSQCLPIMTWAKKTITIMSLEVQYIEGIFGNGRILQRKKAYYMNHRWNVLEKRATKIIWTSEAGVTVGWRKLYNTALHRILLE